MALVSFLVSALWCLLGAAALEFRGDGARHDFASSSVSDPTPEGFDALQARGVDASGMVPIMEDGLHDGSAVTIMGYPPAEDEEISGGIVHSGGKWETFHLSSLCDPWSKEGVRGNFLDVGANIGTYTLPMAECIKGKGAVLSIEGMPSIADHLRAGILANKAHNVAVYGYAVGDGSSLNHVTMALDPKNKGGSSVAGNKPEAASLAKFTVPLTSLDAILHRDPRMVAVLSAKVDIEGNEGRMLKGAQEFFSQHPPCFLTIELIHEWLASAGTPLEGILEQLKSWGYAKVPSLDYLMKCRWRSRTIHIQQKDMEKCVERVAKASTM